MVKQKAAVKAEVPGLLLSGIMLCDYAAVFKLYCTLFINCCSRGKYPVNARGGAWTWNSDARNWGHFYHWNGQQTFWGLEEANHADLAMNYYNFRYAMLKNAEDDARRYFGTDGAFFSDICNINGYQAVEPDTIRNLTVGPQIALDLYRHYQYGADRDFLQKKAYPFMKACLKYYIGLLKKENGVYHIDGGSAAYGSYWSLKDTVTDYCMIKKLIESVLEAEAILCVENPEKSKLQKIEADLFQMPSVECETDGEKTSILSAGTKWDGGAVGITEGDYPWSPFPACQLSAIFPSGFIGLKDAGTESFSKAVRTVRIILDMEFYQSGRMGCSGHTPIPQAVARLGMESEMLTVLRLFAQKYQRFPNGFMHYLDRDAEDFLEGEYRPRLLNGKEKGTVWNNVHEKNDGVRISLPKDGFVQMYYEPSSNFMCGVNEMLLQSHEGVIRVFPAAPDHYTAMFQLKAQGNFLVTSEMIDGEIMYIVLESMSGGRCRIQCPWQSEIRVRTGAEKLPLQLEGGQAVFETTAGNSYILERVEFPLSMYYNCEINADMQSEVKKLGSAVLGKERQF